MAVARMDEAELRKCITQIQLDQSLNDAEKAKKRQELLSGRWSQPAVKDTDEAATGSLDLTSCPVQIVTFSMRKGALEWLQTSTLSNRCSR